VRAWASEVIAEDLFDRKDVVVDGKKDVEIHQFTEKDLELLKQDLGLDS
jgi:hypothetical protein